MDRQSSVRKSTLYVLFLIVLFSSCSPYRQQWKLAAINACCPKASYVKLYFPTCNTFNGLEAEFLSSNGDLQLCLNIHTLQFPSDLECPDHTTVEVNIDDDPYIFTADRLLGGQRLVMPPEACQLIVCALLAGCTVCIKVGRYESTLLPEGFEKHYRRLTLAGA